MLTALKFLLNTPCFIYFSNPGNECAAGCEAYLASGSSFSKQPTQPETQDDHTVLPSLDDQAWQFGFISYDYKNLLENLHSSNPDHFRIPPSFFIKPRFVFGKKEGKWEVLQQSEGVEAQELLGQLSETSPQNVSLPEPAPVSLRSRFSKSEYISRVYAIKKRIREGEIYELNFCQEFFALNTPIDPFLVYERLSRISPAPFSAFCKFGDTFLISSSPERFLKKNGNMLLSQPIKGTRRRGSTPEEDERLKTELLQDEKERAENVMIVDLVRNDLSRIAAKGTVQVDELFGLYTFEQVHQMISTVSCELKREATFEEIIRATFPMGSMTGAPKIRAMQLIEEYETTRRGLYSGALGLISPQGDFDFSVVIRSILYNETEKYLSFMVGSAITDKSDPEQEYEECLVKARGMMLALNAVLA